MARKKVTVIGAGIVGASIAYRLAQNPEVDVQSIDTSTPGGGTSSASMAWLNASNKRPRDYFDLNFAGVREYDKLKSELAADWLHLTGTLAQAAFTPNLEQRAAELEEWGYRVEKTDAATALGKHLPQARIADPGEFVAHYPDEGWIDTNGATRELIGAAAACGAEYQQGCGVTRIDREGSAYRLTLADGTTFLTDVVVNAAGPKADRVAALVGRHLSLAPTKGMTIKFYAPDIDIDKIVLSDQVEVRPDVNGCVRTHADAVDGVMAQGAATDRTELIALMREKAARFLPILESAPIAGVFMGIRPIPEDQFSCVGAVDGIDNYFEAVTHSGVTMGPLIGRLITEYIVNGTKNELLTSRFDPNRFNDLS
ncbi:NAD(P)/FAD-dependent oxidoreductase [Spelaeicoccus albus]|uniref:Glycine/D-amino acid oxidase-like deaminating enzyme n=1 Tax=Spelaeicoccus albus TaxID=1280376 RepID=A0A7Z0AA16_9MICO|nr:FAD-dependent oxidoreductase [Spelaeicoccus albus]NYI67112.1 glycine/D-amino acid oxidase-like deaminating enzyme [Spelaeicoccus albus]